MKNEFSLFSYLVLVLHFSRTNNENLTKKKNVRLLISEEKNVRLLISEEKNVRLLISKEKKRSFANK